MEFLPVLYHEEYNLKYMNIMWTMEDGSSLLPDKPAKIFAILQGTSAMTATILLCPCI